MSIHSHTNEHSHTHERTHTHQHTQTHEHTRALLLSPSNVLSKLSKPKFLTPIILKIWLRNQQKLLPVVLIPIFCTTCPGISSLLLQGEVLKLEFNRYEPDETGKIQVMVYSSSNNNYNHNNNNVVYHYDPLSSFYLLLLIAGS